MQRHLRAACLLLLALLLSTGVAHAELLIRGAGVLDPATGRAAVVDVLVEEGSITRIGAGLAVDAGVRVVDADGLSLVRTCWTCTLDYPAGRAAGGGKCYRMPA